MDRPLLHIISHTDLDGVAAAALAWHVKGGRVARVSLTGYGEVDALILETLASGKEPLVLDLFCQKEQTIDEVDRLYDEARPPFLFDHHKSTFERYGNRKWAVIDTNYCGALVYWNWMSERAQDSRTKEALARLEPIVRIANDRDLWLGQIPESRLWQERGADARGVRRRFGVHGASGGALRRGEGAYMEARRGAGLPLRRDSRIRRRFRLLRPAARP